MILDIKWKWGKSGNGDKSISYVIESVQITCWHFYLLRFLGKTKRAVVCLFFNGKYFFSFFFPLKR